MTMVAAVELDDLLAVGEGTRQTEHAHAGLCARVHEANHLNAGDGVDDHLGEDVLQRAWSTKTGSLLKGSDESCVHLEIKNNIKKPAQRLIRQGQPTDKASCGNQGETIKGRERKFCGYQHKLMQKRR